MVDKYQEIGRPLRVAVDISIWQFQVQSGKGGTNPALRTMYYRLLRLLMLGIEPLFIFDGLNKPPFKRNIRTGSNVASLPNLLTKQMLSYFGFPHLTAPGEAEAECALLQREGIVDAVLSEDVDTLMFGCTMSLRNWSSEGTRGNKSPTHVNAYHSKAIKEGKAGLDREGMVLIALMSGGDYIPAGIPGCGIKIACEAARAGFGKDLCRLSRKDTVGLNQWRERLQYELRTNESGFFRVKHKALRVLETFPDKAVLGYYTHPSISSAEKVQDMKESIVWSGEVDVKGLRAFVADAFEWQHIAGARKFIRGLAPALLVDKLRKRSETEDSSILNLESKTAQELQYIKAICGRRTHFITDGSPEVRISYIPAEIVDLDLDQEESDAYAGFIGTDSEAETPMLDEDDQNQRKSPKKRNPSMYDPSQPEKIWISETFVKIGIPLTFNLWEDNMKDPKQFASRKAREKALPLGERKKKGALDKFVKVTKPRANRAGTIATSTAHARKNTPPSPLAPPAFRMHAAYVEPYDVEASEKTTQPPIQIQDILNTPTKKKSRKNFKPKHSSPIIDSPRKDISVNPWTLSRRPSDTYDVRLDHSKRYSALGIYGSSTPQATSSPTDTDFNNNQYSGSRSPSPTRSGHARPSSSHSAADSDHEQETNASTQLGESSVVQSDQHTPKKKRTTEKKFGESNLIKSPKAPKSNRATRPYCNDSPALISPPQLQCSQRANRILEFGILGAPMVTSPTSSVTSFPSSLLPAQSTLLQLSQNGAVGNNVKITLTYRPRQTIKAKRSRRFIALRESLEGAWKEMEDWEVQAKNPSFAYEDVEVLDLTRT